MLAFALCKLKEIALKNAVKFDFPGWKSDRNLVTRHQLFQKYKKLDVFGITFELVLTAYLQFAEPIALFSQLNLHPNSLFELFDVGNNPYGFSGRL